MLVLVGVSGCDLWARVQGRLNLRTNTVRIVPCRVLAQGADRVGRDGGADLARLPTRSPRHRASGVGARRVGVGGTQDGAAAADRRAGRTRPGCGHSRDDWAGPCWRSSRRGWDICGTGCAAPTTQLVLARIIEPVSKQAPACGCWPRPVSKRSSMPLSTAPAGLPRGRVRRKLAAGVRGRVELPLDQLGQEHDTRKTGWFSATRTRPGWSGAPDCH